MKLTAQETLNRVDKILHELSMDEYLNEDSLPKVWQARELLQAQASQSSVTEKVEICAGCNVNKPFEHRCHGGNCTCNNPICMEQQGRITHEELMRIVNQPLSHRPQVSKGEVIEVLNKYASKHDIAQYAHPAYNTLAVNMAQFELVASELSETKQVSNWISLTDRLPEKGRLVLVYRDIELWQMYVTKWTDIEEQYADWNEITHWMPLPDKPPKNE